MQRRLWEHADRDDDYAAHMDYIPFDPVKHGFVASPADWRCCTFRSCVSPGPYPEEWSGDGAKEVEAAESGGWTHTSEYA